MQLGGGFSSNCWESSPWNFESLWRSSRSPFLQLSQLHHLFHLVSLWVSGLCICVVRWGVLLASTFFCGWIMELAYVCEWEKRPKSTHCPSIPLVCSWSCRNLVAFTTDLKNDDDDKGTDSSTNCDFSSGCWYLINQVLSLMLGFYVRCQSHDSHYRHWTPLGCLLHQLWTYWGHFLSGVGPIRWGHTTLQSVFINDISALIATSVY